MWQEANAWQDEMGRNLGWRCQLSIHDTAPVVLADGAGVDWVVDAGGAALCNQIWEDIDESVDK